MLNVALSVIFIRCTLLAKDMDADMDTINDAFNQLFYCTKEISKSILRAFIVTNLNLEI